MYFDYPFIKITPITLLILLASILVTTVFILSFPVSAAPATSQKGLTLSPVRTEIALNPGVSHSATLSITNTTNTSMTVRLTAEAFSVVNEQYDYIFNAETELTKWVTFAPDIIELATGETKKVPYTVAVPVSAEPDGRYISMFATTDTGTENGGITSQQRIASLLYLSVNGDVTRSGNLIGLSSPWLVQGPTVWTAKVQNAGTTHFRSKYTIEVKTLFNQQLTKSEGDALILPGSIRALQGNFPVPNWPGIYTVHYTIGLGDSPAKEVTKMFVYAPLWLISVIVTGILLIIVAILRRNKIRSKND